MKVKFKYYVIFNVCIATVVLFYLFIEKWNFIKNFEEKYQINTEKLYTVEYKKTNVESEFTLVLKYIHETSKYLPKTVNSFLSKFPLLSVIIVSNKIIPREIMSSLSNSSRIINVPLKLDLLNPSVDRNIRNYIKTNYLLIVPAGVLSLLPHDILSLIQVLNHSHSDFVAVPVKRTHYKCLKLELNLVQWTIQYKNHKSNLYCNSIEGDHGIFMNSTMLDKLGEPFMLPFPEAFYIQATSLNMTVKPINHVTLTNVNKELKKNNFTIKNQIQRQLMNKQLKIKKVIRENGMVEWYGCTRKTQRCFPDVINSIPDYLNQGRWTPPCCLKVLRETVHHVFKVLEKYNIRFWLEGGSLLGAVRMKNIIPWDYDVDIGMYLEDIDKCPWLKIIKEKKPELNQIPSVVDNEGFVWEKSSPEEGDFYRVQASLHNHLHVDIFPFLPKNGIMTKKSWFPNHPQDMEFPEHYLIPLTTIDFAGIKAPAPNNVKEFLELKFGKGCVENPKYPNPKLFPFPKRAKQLVANDSYDYFID